VNNENYLQSFYTHKTKKQKLLKAQKIKQLKTLKPKQQTKP